MSRLKFFYCLIVLCSIGQIAYSTPRLHTESDSLLPLPMTGVFLSHDGFRYMLWQRQDLIECCDKSFLKDRTITVLKANSDSLYLENNRLRANNAVLRQNEKYLKKKLFWKSLSSGLGWGTAAVLAIKLLF